MKQQHYRAATWLLAKAVADITPNLELTGDWKQRAQRLQREAQLIRDKLPPDMTVYDDMAKQEKTLKEALVAFWKIIIHRGGTNAVKGIPFTRLSLEGLGEIVWRYLVAEHTPQGNDELACICVILTASMNYASASAMYRVCAPLILFCLLTAPESAMHPFFFPKDALKSELQDVWSDMFLAGLYQMMTTHYI